MGLVYGAVGLVALLCVAKSLYALSRNYRAAHATGLPLVVVPYDPDSLVHTILSEPLRPVLHLLLPAAAYQVFELSTYGWEFRDKGAIHERLGPFFIVVTTGLNRLICADPAVGQTILARRKDFIHPDISVQAMGILGSNIITNNDKDWSRQRRIVAPALSERISAGVWTESGAQAGALADMLLAAPTSVPDGGSADTIPGLRAVAINVLTRIAYGRHKPFALPSDKYDPGAALSYVDAIALVTELLVVAAFAPARLLQLPGMPRALQTLGVALERLPALARDMLDRERHESLDVTHNSSKTSDTIMRTLVRLSDQQKEQAADGSAHSSVEKPDAATGTGASKSFLTEDEIAGNLFIFTAAGFDTTANTMAYAVALLAAHPEWQAWVQEELDDVLGPAPPSDDGTAAPLPDYETTFSKLVRCLAVMLETLRLYPPVTLLMRSAPAAQLISTDAAAAAGLPSSFLLNGPCAAHVNTMALHTARATWGADALEFRPARWLRASDGDDDDDAPPSLATPPRGVFLPWSLGPRTCPGQKMSQVEFVAVVATLLRRAAVEVVPGPGRSAAEARRDLLRQTQDSQPVLTLQMNRPQDVRLRWVPRAVPGL